MRKVEKLSIGYVGYKEPTTEAELQFELLGLENAIKNAELRISVLKQGLQLNAMMLRSHELNRAGDLDDASANIDSPVNVPAAE